MPLSVEETEVLSKHLAEYPMAISIIVKAFKAQSVINSDEFDSIIKNNIDNLPPEYQIVRLILNECIG